MTLADMVAAEAERAGVDLALLVSEGWQAVAMADDPTVDAPRRALALEIACAAGVTVGRLMAVAMERRLGAWGALSHA